MEEVAKVTMSEQDEEMECTFTVYEIDLDYEFDAARFFDFTRLESPLEARQAEVWFHSAGSYPPSPFVANFVPRDEMLMENLCTSPKSKGVENMNPAECVSDVEDEEVISVVDTNNRDFDGKAYGTFNSLQIGSRTKLQNSSKNLPSGYTKSKPYTKLLTKKPSFPRTSTLLKPTASQLAKQNHPPQTGYASARSNTSVEKMDKSSVCTFGIENHAAKRQKLEGGLLRKVVDAEQPQQISFVHKVPKQDGITNHTKTRITIPREPDLETSHRSLKTRPKTSKESENGTSTVRRFKALPLNRKILTSKGTFGVFRNSKKDTTVPMEFNFQTEKRFNHNPPIELFNKLSLAPETQQTANHESKLPRSNSTSAKGSKENRWGCFQKGNEIKQPSKARLPVLVGKQHIGVEAEKIEVYAASCLNWSNSVR
ncbi:uncharacterized protein [Primulina eburnea]|uniref:uncharacterized protein isoform X5 n=1 Tax=Primulina eburnea TaxID=1245227 RepID=UPI003C6C109C